MVENPISSCLHPRKVENPYTHDTILVSCNHCPACMNKRASRYKRLCELESLGEYSVCFFLTLTYDKEHVPTARLVPIGDDYYNVISTNRVHEKDYLNDESILLTKEQISKYQAKMKYFNYGEFSYLYYPDVQLFIKRLRKLYYKRYGEQFRFFCAGEYGPDTLRAHWHIILFTKKGVPPLLKEDIYETWRQGRVDYDYSRGGCISYAASYANSAMCLPSFYKNCKIQNVNRHSIQLGSEIYLSSWLDANSFSIISRNSQDVKYRTTMYRPTLDKDGSGRINRCLSLVCGDKARNYPIDKTYEARLYPTQYASWNYSNDECVQQYYRIYYIFRDYLRLNNVECQTIKDMVYMFIDYCLSHKDIDNVLTQTFLFLGIRSEQDLCEVDDFSKAFGRIYRFFLQSKNSNQYFSSRDVKKIKNRISYDSLTDSLRAQETTDLPPILFYTDTFEQSVYEKSSVYSLFKNENTEIHSQKLRKKRFNDLLNLI